MPRHTDKMMQNLDDNQLVAKACAGDSRAFEILVERHYDRMFRMAFKWCRNRESAEDITQNACIKLARAISSFNGRAAFTSWLYRLVINTAIDWQRQNGKPTEELGEETVSVPAGVEEKMMAEEGLAKVMALPEKEKTALLLVLGEGLSHKEVAVIMECRESTISWYIHEARKKLGVETSKGKKERHHG